jgi:hypothetical protein
MLIKKKVIKILKIILVIYYLVYIHQTNLTPPLMLIRLTKTIILLCIILPSQAQDTDSLTGDYTLSYEFRVCKLPEIVYIQIMTKPVFVPAKVTEKKKSLMSITGEMSYQHFERSGNSDDLLLINSASNIATLKLDLLYKETYPFALSVRYNQNQPFQLDDQYEVNLGFDDRKFRERVREKLIGSVKNDYLKKQLRLTDQYKKAFDTYQQQKQFLKSPGYIQRMAEARLRNPALPVPGIISENIPSFNNKFDRVNQLLADLPGFTDMQKLKQRIKDSVDNRIEGLNAEKLKNNLHAKLEQQRDSLEKVVKGLEDSLARQKKELTGRLDSLNKEVTNINSSTELKKYADQKGLKDSTGNNKWTDILMKSNIRLGKFLVNHSELTVNNIFLHGASIKYGDEKFVQVSAGFYDFAFRQVFNFRNDTLPRNKQSVLAIKTGKTDGKNLTAFSFYIGRKTRTGSLNDALRTVAGVGMERKIYFSRNLSVDFEIAKSTTRPNSLFSKNEETLKDLFGNFSTKTIGIYGSVQAYMPKTGTDAEISYRYWGQQFESFNAGQYFNPQNNLAGKLSQPFFKRKLYISTGIRYTDFSTFGIASNMKSKTLFASANATLRLKKIPIISIGYYPGSQLYWLDQNKLYEYFYYILNTTVSHHFRAGKIPVQAVFTWNKFYNKYTDSLVTGSQSYYNLFLTAWKNNFSYTMNVSRQEIENDLLSTVEGGLNYAGRTIKAGGSLKWNCTGGVTKMGYSFCGGLLLKKIGTINFIYDQSFLPDRRGQFIPVTTGQVQIIKPLKFTIWQ